VVSPSLLHRLQPVPHTDPLPETVHAQGACTLPTAIRRRGWRRRAGASLPARATSPPMLLLRVLIGCFWHNNPPTRHTTPRRCAPPPGAAPLLLPAGVSAFSASLPQRGFSPRRRASSAPVFSVRTRAGVRWPVPFLVERAGSAPNDAPLPPRAAGSFRYTSASRLGGSAPREQQSLREQPEKPLRASAQRGRLGKPPSGAPPQEDPRGKVIASEQAVSGAAVSGGAGSELQPRSRGSGLRGRTRRTARREQPASDRSPLWQGPLLTPGDGGPATRHQPPSDCHRRHRPPPCGRWRRSLSGSELRGQSNRPGAVPSAPAAW